MKTKFHWMVCLVLSLSMAFSSAAVPVAAMACAPAFVAKTGHVITVKATSVDDTANLQCAFDMAVKAGPRVNVRLLKGTYHTGQIVVNNFHGTFTGAGLNKTLVTNLPNLYVTPVDVIFNPPSVGNPWPSLISFVEGDFTISDLAIHIQGENTTQGWSIFGISPPIIELAQAVLIIGDQANARIERVLVEGQAMQNSLLGYNLINGICYEGFFGEPPARISGVFAISDSIFRTVGSANCITSLSEASVLVTRNTYGNVLDSLDGGDLINSNLEFSHNKVDAVIGMDLYNGFTPEDTGTSYLIKYNIFRGAEGIFFEPIFGAGNKCLIIGNNVQDITDIGIYLGSGTKGCLVIGDRHKTNVLDEGTDNILIRVNKMGSGVGPAIQSLSKLRK
jgi:hypothetical protein